MEFEGFWGNNEPPRGEIQPNQDNRVQPYLGQIAQGYWSCSAILEAVSYSFLWNCHDYEVLIYV